MAIAFVCNKDLTRSYAAIAEHLRLKGEDVAWMSPSSRWTQWLVQRGVERSDILNMPDFADEWREPLSPSQRIELAGFETDPSVTAHHVVRMCRGLHRRDPEISLAYVHAVARHADSFLRDKKVEIVFGEGTWGFELAIWMAAQRLNLPMVTPVTTRIPSSRFCMVDAVIGKLHRVAEAAPADVETAAAFLDEWRARPRPPAYAASSSGYKPFHARWMRELWQVLRHPYLEKGDETLWRVSERIQDRVARALWAGRAERYLKGRPQPENEPFVLFCLQHQPEAAVDVYGGFHSNQFATIERLARRLPASHRLWVREHRGALGDHPVGWYKQLEAMPGVRLVDPFSDIYELMRRASAVVTISGTVAYEAALLGVPALALADMFFGDLLACPASRMGNILDWPMERILEPSTRADYVADRNRSIACLARIFANSWEGDPADGRLPDTFPAGKHAPKSIEAEAISRYLALVRSRSTGSAVSDGKDRRREVLI